MSRVECAPEEFRVDVDGVTMSGSISEVEHPRAVIVAWHGGATTPEYFDSPGKPQDSLLRLGAQIGITVVAPHRPGYGASKEFLGDDLAPEVQTSLAFGTVDAVLQGRRRGAGVFLLGHSQGCVLAMRMASDPRGSNFLGLEIAGTGIAHNDRVRAARLRSDAVESDRTVLRSLLWEPARLYEGRSRVLTAAPAFDGVDASTWPTEFGTHARLITRPVRLSLGDHEYWWQSPPEGLNAMAELFAASRRVVTNEQFDSGHNTSLGISARSYHLGVLAFVEECLPTRHRIGFESYGMEKCNA